MRIIIIGAGASGLMAAISAGRTGQARITVLEQNQKPGRKLLATGNGRCNLTNMDADLSNYYSETPRLISQVFKAFSFGDTLQLFHELGLETREREGWVYPYSEQASAVLDLLLAHAARLGITLKYDQHIIGVEQTAEGFAVKTSGWTYTCDRLIIASGGAASNVEGSSLDGLSFAADLGLPVVEPYPVLVPVKAVGKKLSLWAGARKEAKVSLYVENALVRQARGEVLFTDYGVSGICIFQLSGDVCRAAKDKKKMKMVFDLMPDHTVEQLTVLLEHKASLLGRTQPKTLLLSLLPDRLIDVVADDKNITIPELAARIKNYPLTVTGTHSFVRAQAMGGGVSLCAVHPDTMEAKQIPGLYFAGEVLDVYGLCGGYNLQWAWSTGYLAGRSAAAVE